MSESDGADINFVRDIRGFFCVEARDIVLCGSAEVDLLSSPAVVDDAAAVATGSATKEARPFVAEKTFPSGLSGTFRMLKHSEHKGDAT